MYHIVVGFYASMLENMVGAKLNKRLDIQTMQRRRSL